MNIKQCNIYLNSKSQKKVSNIIIYEYKNGPQGQKTFEKYFIPNSIR